MEVLITGLGTDEVNIKNALKSCDSGLIFLEPLVGLEPTTC